MNQLVAASSCQFLLPLLVARQELLELLVRHFPQLCEQQLLDRLVNSVDWASDRDITNVQVRDCSGQAGDRRTLEQEPQRDFNLEPFSNERHCSRGEQ